ncbi:MAG: hypothetical protein B6U94_05135 [Thermofilum sp. ex4484_79]|nr:MAG: hypothetical protein B6U94_05135 [Thermofilum sp. ex4484_79]
MELSKIFLLFIAIALILLGSIFLIASVVKPYRLFIGVALFGGGIAIALYAVKSKPKIVELKVSWNPSGKLTTEELKCPYCGASLPLPSPGQEFIKCPYCGRTVKLIEEPKW